MSDFGRGEIVGALIGVTVYLVTSVIFNMILTRRAARKFMRSLEQLRHDMVTPIGKGSARDDLGS